MKILIATPDLFDDTLPEFQKNRTGFGIMVRKIAGNLSADNVVTVFTKTLTGGYCVSNSTDHFFIWKHLYFDLLSDACLRDYRNAIRLFFQFNQSMRRRIKYFAYHLNVGSFRKCIFSCKPDIVHIHGISYATRTFIEVCEELHQPYIVTLHGCIGLSKSINLLPHEKQIEGDFLRFAEKHHVTVTTVSSGTKRTMIDLYSLHNNSNMIVIPNGVDILYPQPEKMKDICAMYKIPQNHRIVLVIGSVYKNKNQVQIVDAFNYMPLDLQNTTYILFIGQICDNGQLQQKIRKSKYCNHFIMSGFINHDELGNFYQSASLNVIASISEGFGLSSVEAFHYGVPTVMFSDLDAVDDLYDSCAVLLIEDRSDEALGKGMAMALNMNWNHSEICDFAGRFSMNGMIRKYQDVYYDVLKTK